MPFYQSGPTRYYKFNIFENPQIYHAIFTRQGGVSPSPWESLNLGGSVGDQPARVANNRRIALDAIGVKHDSLYDVFQVHSSDVIFTNKPRPKEAPYLKADAIITDQPNITLLMKFADCVPILLYDPVHHGIGIVHAGWKGTVDKIINKVLLSMGVKFGSQPADIFASIGPSIGPDHYPVGAEVVNKIKMAFGHVADSLLLIDNGAVKFNLWTANQLTLIQSGVNNIEICKICTACHLDDWFSHRGENGKTGRFGAVIGLKY
jgi:purine-nucleoside/S-methyl-5'-thioadenosine phosphorylase / adenosine deaminase